MLSKSCIDSEAFQTLESDLNKLRYENLKLQKELKKSQENLALRGQVITFHQNLFIKTINN